MDVVTTALRTLLIGLAGSTAQTAGRVALVLVAGYFGARVLRTLLGQLERFLVTAGERTRALPRVTPPPGATPPSLLRTPAPVTLLAFVRVICLSQPRFDRRPTPAAAGTRGL